MMHSCLTALLSKYDWSIWLAEKGIASYVAGESMAGDGEIIEFLDPTSEAPLFSYLDGNASVVDQAVARATEAQTLWAAETTDVRATVMRRLAASIRERLQALAEIESLTAGRPIKDCLAQVDRVADMFEYYAGWADKIYGEVIPVPNGYLNYTLREPVGVLLHIVPWNSPLFMAAWHIAPSIAVGNAVLLKPSELTPVTAILLVRTLEDAGLPVGLVNVLAGCGNTMGTYAIQHSGVHKVGFVGSPATGRKVAMAAAEKLKPCLLELGGKSANVVFEDADLAKVTAATVKGIFIGAGQTCVASSRLIVHRSVQDEMVKLLLMAASRLRMGSVEDARTDIGPIHNARQYRHVNAMIAKGIEAGASASVADTSCPSGGFYVKPTILTGVTPDMDVAQTEIFGPVLSVIPFDTEDEAIQIANGTEFGLAGAVWTKDVERAHRVAAKVNCGTFWINTYKSTDIRSPFGGNAMSGFGRSSGREALLEYTRLKSVWLAR